MAVFRAPKKQDTEKFYDDLIAGRVARSLWGAESRFEPTAIAQKSSVQRYFREVLRPYLDPSMTVLDFGCGTGGFSMAIAPLVERIEGIDLSRNFIETGRAAIAASTHQNINIQHVQGRLPFADDTFDAIVMVDLVHHLDELEVTMNEAMRTLKPGGRLFVFEPNKLNVPLAIMCLFDRNEWGLLRLGRPGIYRRLLAPYIDIDRLEFNGLLVGPESDTALRIADALDHGALSPVLKWMSPKIFVTGLKKPSA